MARLNTLNVSLTATLEKYVRAKVKSGHYESASEVIRDSLRALQARERAADGFWDDVREKVAVAREQVTLGQTVDGERAMAEIIAELDAPLTKAPKRKRSSR